MKKITLALCACAFALTGVLASCSNEAASANYIDRTNTYSNYKYAVAGTITTTESSETLRNASTWALDKDGKAYKSTTTTTSKINGGFVTVSWNADENRNSNYTTYSFDGDYVIVESTSNSSNTFDGDFSGASKEISKGGASVDIPTIYDVDGTYYVSIDGHMVDIETLAISEDDDAFSGDFGSDFELNIKITKNNLRNISWNEDDDNDKKAKKSDTTTKEYKLVFTPIESFDPEDALEDDE